MIELATIQAAAQVAGGRLITGIATGLVLMTFTAMVLPAIRRSSTRFAVCFLTLLAVAVLPVASCFVGGHANGIPAAFSFAIRGQWAVAIFGVWIVGAAMGLSRVIAGLIRASRIKRGCVELDASLVTALSAASVEGNRAFNLNFSRLGARRNVSLCISDDVSVPTAIGFFRPAILLPSWATTELSASELNSILLHELGHLRRGDDWTNLAQKILQALLFFHPAVWWIDSRLALEREAACDDLVVAKTSDAHGYAKCLVSVAEKSVGRRAFSLTVAAVSRVRETAARLTRILDQNRPAGTRVSKPALAAFATLTLALLVEMPRVPAIVEFRNAVPATLAHQSGPAIANDTQSVPAIVPASSHIETGDREGLSRPILRKAELRTRGVLVASDSARTNSASRRQVRMNRVQNENLKPSPAVQTSWSQEKVAPTFLLVTQTVGCDEYGNCFVTVRTWQVLTLQRTRDQAQKGNDSKSI